MQKDPNLTTTTTTRSVKLKPPQMNSATSRRSRFVNGSSTRSRSLDNEKSKNRCRKLYKSQTLTSISMKAKNRHTENGNGNGNGECRRTSTSHLKIFNMNVDQSPLWTTLTHARTLSDFTAESWLHFFRLYSLYAVVSLWNSRYMWMKWFQLNLWMETWSKWSRNCIIPFDAEVKKKICENVVPPPLWFFFFCLCNSKV